MARLSFLWHLHQPSYRTADRVSHAPWTALHAGGAYRTLASAILETPGRGQVVNIVPTLLEQLIAYRDQTVTDPVVEAVTTPAGDLSEAQRELLVEWGFHVTPRQMGRYQRLGELARRRPVHNGNARLSASFGLGDIRDLQILFVLAQAGEQAWRDQRLAALAARGRGFNQADHDAMTAWLAAQPGELIELWRRLASQPGVELSTSPYAHPIMPLLIDTGIVVESWAPAPAPTVPPFRHPDDAARQLECGLELMRRNGLEIAGCWPPEGSVSAEALAIYAEAGVRWLVTDEGILEKSLGRPVREQGKATPELYRPWRLKSPGPTLFFRDRQLSDAIGFRYGHWDDEARAARSLVQEIAAVGHALPDDATVVLALDGENPWLHYPDGGGRFLRELMAELGNSGDDLELETLSDMTADSPAAVLETLHPGSWINGVFATWIGHPEKTAAWDLLGSVRDAIANAGAQPPPSLLLAEASDWFWWLGDDNPTELAPLYDQIFRRHLADACAQAGIDPPANLEQPLKTVTRPVVVPMSASWRPPTFDGRITSYFEWCLATRIDGGDRHQELRVALWKGPDQLYLLIEGDQPMQLLLADVTLHVKLERGDGGISSVAVGPNGCDSRDADCATGRVVEISLPWNGTSPARLEIRLGSRRLPDGAVLLLDPFAVDEQLTARSTR